MKVRVAGVQYEQKRIADWQSFEAQVTHHAQVAADQACDFVLYPELFTLQLLSINKTMLTGAQAIDQLTGYTERLHTLFTRLAKEKDMTVILGSHPSKHSDGVIRNTAYIYAPHGKRQSQDKIHATPSEREAWGIKGGREVKVFEANGFKYGVLICYDSEFPELARILLDQGAQLIFVPFCTEDQHGYLRVRYSSQARAVENQCYMVLAGNVGDLEGVYNMDAQYGQSGIFTPCDHMFPREGIAAQLEPNIPGLIFADLDMALIDEARKNGTVRNVQDRRLDLYSVVQKTKE